jgi:micrococcal nuclease
MGRAVLVVMTIVLLAGCTSLAQSPSRESALVARAIDGDTLVLENGSRVRLLGINTPEKGERLAGDAKRELSWLEGSVVGLERDVESGDRYGRLLRYVYFEGELVNEKLVEKGLAHVYRSSNRMHLNELLAAEERARRAGIGIWQESNDSCLALVEFGYKSWDERIILENACPYELGMTSWKVKDEATNMYKFPVFALGPSMLVTLHTGNGTDNATDLYWNSSKAVWNNQGDRLFVTDSQGFLALFEEY